MSTDISTLEIDLSHEHQVELVLRMLDGYSDASLSHFDGCNPNVIDDVKDMLFKAILNESINLLLTENQNFVNI